MDMGQVTTMTLPKIYWGVDAHYWGSYISMKSPVIVGEMIQHGPCIIGKTPRSHLGLDLKMLG